MNWADYIYIAGWVGVFFPLVIWVCVVFDRIDAQVEQARRRDATDEATK